MGKIYGYARVSTCGQSRDGNSLEDQVALLKKNGCEEIIEEAFSGKTVSDRPKFKKLIDSLEQGDTLIVCKLDRFARSTIEGVQTIKDLFSRGVTVNILNMGLIEDTLNGNLIMTVLLAFAEYERGMIIERTQSGKVIAKQNPNFKEGRPKKYSEMQLSHAYDLLRSGRTYREVEQMTSICKSTLNRYRRTRET